VAFDWARAVGTPVAFVLAGGYVSRGRQGLTQAALVDLHRLTIAAAASCTDTDAGEMTAAQT
jgi:hypothetical protein